MLPIWSDTENALSRNEMALQNSMQEETLFCRKLLPELLLLENNKYNSNILL